MQFNFAHYKVVDAVLTMIRNDKNHRQNFRTIYYAGSAWSSTFLKLRTLIYYYQSNRGGIQRCTLSILFWVILS